VSARRSGPTRGPVARHWLRQTHQSEASALLRVLAAQSAASPAEEHAAKLLAVMQRAGVPTAAPHLQHAARLLALAGQLQGFAFGAKASQVGPATNLKALRTLAQAHASSGFVPRVGGGARDEPRPSATPRFSAATQPQTIGPPSLAMDAAKKAWMSAVLDPNGTGIYREHGYASQAQAQEALSSVLARYTQNNLGAGSRVEAAAVIYRQELRVNGQLQTRYFPSTVLLGEPNAPGTPPHITADMVERLYNGGRPQGAVAVAFNHSHPTEQGAGAIGKLLGPSQQDILAQADGVIYRHLRGREQNIVQSVVAETPSGPVTRTFEIRARLKEGAPLNVLQSPTQHNWSRFVELEVKLIGGGNVPFGPDERYVFNIQRKDAQGNVVGKRLDRDLVINANNYRDPVRTASVATPTAANDARPLSMSASGAKFSAPSSEEAPQPITARFPGTPTEKQQLAVLMSSLVLKGWRIGVEGNRADAPPLTNLDERAITMGDPARLTAAQLTETFSLALQVSDLPGPLQALTERFPGIDWSRLDYHTREGVWVWAKDPKTFTTDRLPAHVGVRVDAAAQVLGLHGRTDLRATMGRVDTQGRGATPTRKAGAALQQTESQLPVNRGGLSASPPQKSDPTGALPYERFIKSIQGDRESVDLAVQAAKELRGLGWQFVEGGNDANVACETDRDEKRVLFRLPHQGAAKDLARVLRSCVEHSELSPPKKLLSTLYPNLDWAKLKPPLRETVLSWIATPESFGDDAQQFETRIAPTQYQESLSEAARQLGLADVLALRRALGKMSVVGPGVLAHNPKAQTTVLGPLGRDKTLDSFLPFARTGWVIDRGEGMAPNQTEVDLANKRILVSDLAWEPTGRMGSLLPAALVKARGLSSSSDLQQRYPHLEWDELSTGALKTLSAWQQRGFDAGKHPGEATKAAKLLGYPNLDALRAAMQQPPQPGFVDEAEWERLGVSAAPLRKALAALTPDRANVMRALLADPLRAVQQPALLTQAAGTRFTAQHLLARALKLTDLEQSGRPPKLSSTVTDASQKRAADVLARLKGSATPALQARIEAALEALAQEPPAITTPSPDPVPAVVAETATSTPTVTATPEPTAPQPETVEVPAATLVPELPAPAGLIEKPARVADSLPTPTKLTAAAVSNPEPTKAADPNTPLAARVQALSREGIAQTPLLLDVKARAVEIANALDHHNQIAAVGARVDLDVDETMALALYWRAATVARKPGGAPDLRQPTLNNQYSETTQKALSTYLTGTPAGADVPKLAMSALRKLYLAEHPNNDFPKTFVPRALASLDRLLGAKSDAAVADPAKQAALAGVDMLVACGALSTEAVQSLLEKLGLANPTGRGTQAPTPGNDTERSTGTGWSLSREDIRDYPVKVQSAAQLALERREGADALVSALGAVSPSEAGAAEPGSFLFNVGLRALREGHATGVATLMDASWRNGIEPSTDQIRASLFSGLQDGKGYVRAVVGAYVQEVRDSMRLAFELRRQPGQADTRLTPIQATAALRLENKALEALTLPSGESPQRYLLSLPQANDNRRAAFAALARIGRDADFSTGVVVWTTSKFLAEGAVPDEAKAALGDRFEIVTSATDMVDRAGARDRKRPLLAVLGDDALAGKPELITALSKRLGARRLIYVADEVQRLRPGSDRTKALAPLAARADVTMALSATPIGRKADDLGQLGQMLGILPPGRLPSDPRALYTQMAPHFMAGGAQRPTPSVAYLPVLYSNQGFDMHRYVVAQPGVDARTLQVIETQNNMDEKLDVLASRTAERVRSGGKVIIGSHYKAEGIDRIVARLALGDTASVRVGRLDGATSVATRRDILRRFKLPAADAEAIDALVMTFKAAQGDTAVDVNRPPAGGFEVIAANVPSTPIDMAALTGLVNQEALPAEVPVRVTIPIVRFTDGQKLIEGKGALTADQTALSSLRELEHKAAGATGTQQGRSAYQPTAAQLSRYSLGRGYRGMEPGYFPGIDQLIAYMEANERPAPWQQATQYLQDRVHDNTTLAREAGKTPRLLDLGSGYNYLVTSAIKAGWVGGNDAYGIDQIPSSAMAQLVERGKLAAGSDTHHVEGQIERASEVLKAKLGSEKKFNIVTASFSLMGREPAMIASYFRAANAVLEPGGRFLIVHPLSSFDPQRRADFDRGLGQMGFKLVHDWQLDTVGAPIRYLELERTADPVRDVDVALFRL
jgi:SAM-dependent methyltransferase